MNTTLSLSAFAVALAVSGQAFAGLAENRAVVNAIMAAQAEGEALDFTFNRDPGWTGLEDPDARNSDGDRYPNGSDFSGTEWTANDEDDNPCDYAGIICDDDGNMTNIEVPNANLKMTAEAFFDALSGVAGDLRTINYSVTSVRDPYDKPNHITGTMPDLSAFTQLRVLAVNGVSTGGVIPDMSALTELEHVDLSDSAFTGITGQIGGDKLEVLKIGGNPSLVADLTPTLDASANSLRELDAAGSPVFGQIPDYSANDVLTHFTVNDSGLGGTLNLNATSGLEASGNFNVTNTGIAGGTNTTPGNYSPLVGQLTISSANAGDTAGTIYVAWSAATDADGYLVQTSDDDGDTWTLVESGSIKFPTTTTATVSGLDTGNYLVRVIAYHDESNGEGTSYQVHGTAVVTTESITVTANSGTTGGGSGGGGGAAWLLLALPFLARRRRAC